MDLQQKPFMAGSTRISKPHVLKICLRFYQQAELINRLNRLNASHTLQLFGTIFDIKDFS